MKKILVIIDMQNDFVTGVLGSAAAVAALDNIVDLINKVEFDKIFFTRDIHTDNYLTTREGKKLPIPHCLRGTEGAMLCDAFTDRLLKDKSYDIVDKDTFGSLELIRLIDKKQECIEVYICGVCTDICVVSNALILMTNPIINLTVIEDCCAGTSKEAHEAALTVMKNCLIDIKKKDEVINNGR